MRLRATVTPTVGALCPFGKARFTSPAIDNASAFGKFADVCWHRDDRPRGARGRARSKRRWRPRQRAVRCELRLLPTAGVTPIPLTTFSRSSGHRSCESHFELERPESRSSSHVKTLGGRYTANTRRRDHRIVGGTRKFLRCNDGRFWHMAVDFVSAATPSAFYRYRFLGGPWPPTGSTQASKRESNVRGSQ